MLWNTTTKWWSSPVLCGEWALVYIVKCPISWSRDLYCKVPDLLDFKGNYSVTSNNTKLVHWLLVGGLLHLVQGEGTERDCSPPRPLLAVPNVTAHPSTASVPITVLLMMVRCSAILMWRALYNWPSGDCLQRLWFEIST